MVPQSLTQLADKIVLCFDRANAAAVDAAGETSQLLARLWQAGARGAIIARFPRSILPDCSGITCVLVDYDVGEQIANYASVETARSVSSISILIPTRPVQLIWESDHG